MPAFTLYLLGTKDKFLGLPKKKNILNTFAEYTDPAPTKSGKLVLDNQTKNASLALDGPGFRGTEVTPNAVMVADELYHWLINRLREKQDEPININLATFSRGSVTGLVALNLLNERLRSEGINIPENDQEMLKNFNKNINNLRFLFYANDTVSGLGDKGNVDQIVIPEIKINVKVGNNATLSKPIPLDHIAPLQVHEERREFKPQDKTRQKIENFESTNSVILPTFGNHSDTVKYKSDALADALMINYNLMYRALTSHGTRFKEHDINPVEQEYQNDKKITRMTKIPPMYGELSSTHKTDSVLDIIKIHEDNYHSKPSGHGSIYYDVASDTQLLEHFAQAKKNRSAYEKSGKKFKLDDNVPFTRTKRTFTKQLEYYVEGSHFFTNQFERELFKNVYPSAFNFLFERGINDQSSKRDPEDLEKLQRSYVQDLKKMRENNPKLFKSLKDLNIKYNKEKNIIDCPNTPQGNYKLETCRLTAAVKGESVKTKDFYSTQLALLENEVVQSTMRYQREKDAYMAFYKRAHHDEATDIRAKIQSISYGKGTPQEKYKKALDFLNDKFKELYQNGSVSDLKDRLERILNNHGVQFHLEEKKGFFKSLVVGLGFGINYLGKIFNAAANAISTVFGFGRLIEDAGTRLSDIGVPSIGAGIEVAGYIIRKFLGIPFVLDFLGKLIQKGGNTIISSSGFYGYSKAETYTPREPEQHILEMMHVTSEEAKEELLNKSRKNDEQKLEVVHPQANLQTKDDLNHEDQARKSLVEEDTEEDSGDTDKPHV